MIRVVSFCLYGSDPKQRVGLQKNLELLPEGYEMWVQVGSDVEPDQNLPGARILRCDCTGQRLMFERFRAIEEADLVFFRDADSRMRERDRWCMAEFEKSEKLVHIIRDHFWHKSRIMGGAWGAKKGAFPRLDWEAWVAAHGGQGQGKDEAFLAEAVYPNSRPLIHSSIVGYPGEDIQLIRLNETDDFVGQVQDAEDRPKFRQWDFPQVQHIKWLASHDQWRILERLISQNSQRPREVLQAWFQARFYLKNYVGCQEVLRQYRQHTVDDHVIQQTNQLIPHLGLRVVGTTDVHREPQPGELVIVYGNFLHSVDTLPAENKILRHAGQVSLVKHDVFESDPAWSDVDVIQIMNLETRRDRWQETMAELARMRAPLDRVVHQLGKPAPNPAQGATQNHVDCLRMFVQSGKKTALFLEDDFTFTSRVDTHLQNLKTFLDRKQDQDVCLLSTSKQHTWKPQDDLLDLSQQECTTSAGQLVTKGAEILRVVEEGLEKMKKGDGSGVVDRQWAILQPRNKFQIFREKMGQQRCGQSNIKNTVTAQFD